MINTIEEPKIVSFDMDGVIADFGGNLIHKMLSRPHLAQLITPETYNTFTHWDLDICFPEQYRDEIREIINTPGFFRDIPPIGSSLEILERVIDNGYKTAICTKPSRVNPMCQIEKSEWIVEHLHPRLGKDGITDIIFTKNKRIYPFYTHIDDKEYYDDFLNGLVRWIPITFAQPWNVEDQNPLRMTKDNYIDIFAQIGIYIKQPQRYWHTV